MKLLKEQWKVAPIAYHMACQMVERFHYAKSHSNQFTALHGLFEVTT